MATEQDAPAWQAPPLTVTASSSPTDERSRRPTQVEHSDEEGSDVDVQEANNGRRLLDGGTQNGRPNQYRMWSDSGDASSPSRISDHIELPKRDDDSNSHTKNDGDDENDDGNNHGNGNNSDKRKKKRNQDKPAQRRRNGNQRLLLGPGLKWHKEYSDLDVQAGRVLVIDYARSDESHSHMRKVAAQEIFHKLNLRQFYQSQDPGTTPAMRVIHVQNADWAVPFLLRKYNISTRSREEDTGSDFGRYLRYKNPEIRGGKPFLAGKTWKVQYDPWRGVNKTSFGLDYMKSFPARKRGPSHGGESNGNHSKRRDRMMQLNDFNDDDEPICGHYIYVQRLSCYIQHKQAPSENRLTREDLPLKKHFYPPDVYGGDNFKEDKEEIVNGSLTNKPEFKPRLRHFDNGNVIIIFDNSSSGNFDDTLIPARRDVECRWRRLPFHLAFESREPVEDDDTKLALSCSKSILNDVFKSLAVTWDTFLDHAGTHMTILEDKIYDQPDDESRAPELWANSSAWLKVEKLVNVHTSVMNEMKTRLHELTEDVDTDSNWLDDSPGDFERLSNLVTEDLTKPTESLISLLYQSVSIRDSRHSLELGVSMWRLSWITFIFLPLTFIVGFFGMNVDTFTSYPSIKWYFVAAVPFMFGVLTFYFLMKGGTSDSRQRSPHERAVYETFFQEMADREPALWSRNGPRDYVHVQGKLARLKWRLIKYWLRPMKYTSDATIATTTTSAALVTDAEDAITGRAFLRGGVGGDGLSTYSRLKRYLSKRWTNEISGRATASDLEMGLIGLNDDEFDDIATASGDERLSGDHHHIGEGLTEIAEILAAATVPRAGRPGMSYSAPSSLDHEHDKDDDHSDQETPLRTHLTVPGAPPKSLRTTTVFPAVPHDDEHDSDNMKTSDIPNPVIAAAIARDQARERLRSDSSPSPSPRRGRGGSRGSRPRSSGSAGKNSDRVLVEEEDAAWLNERGRKGKDWVWRRSLLGEGSGAEGGSGPDRDEGNENDNTEPSSGEGKKRTKNKKN